MQWYTYHAERGPTSSKSVICSISTHSLGCSKTLNGICFGIDSRARYTLFCRSHRFFSPSVIGIVPRLVSRNELELKDVDDLRENEPEADESRDSREISSSVNFGDETADENDDGNDDGKKVDFRDGWGSGADPVRKLSMVTERPGTDEVAGGSTVLPLFGDLGRFVRTSSACVPVGSCSPAAVTSRINTPTICAGRSKASLAYNSKSCSPESPTRMNLDCGK